MFSGNTVDGLTKNYITIDAVSRVSELLKLLTRERLKLPPNAGKL